MIITRGQPFKEVFDVKDPQGRPVRFAGHTFLMVITRKGYIRELPMLKKGSQLTFSLTAEQTSDFDASAFSYKIVFNNASREVVQQGTLHVENG